MEATEGVSSATLATLLIITLALGWKYNSLATRSINTTQVFFFKGPMCCLLSNGEQKNVQQRSRSCYRVLCKEIVFFFFFFFLSKPRISLCCLLPCERHTTLTETLTHPLVLLFGPRPFDELRVENLLPPVLALHICAILAGQSTKRFTITTSFCTNK